MKVNRDILEKFFLDPEWKYVAEFIESHFEASTDVLAIDANRDPSAVAAEVVAIQKITHCLNNLRSSYAQIRSMKDRKPISYR